MKPIIAIAQKDLIDDLKTGVLLYVILGIFLAAGLIFYFIFNSGASMEIGPFQQTGTETSLLNSIFKMLDISGFDQKTSFTLLLLNTVYFYILILIALILPTILSSTCIVSEKEQRTIEYLFTLPIKNNVLLTGKMLGSVIPSFLLVIFCYTTILIFTWIKFNFSTILYLLRPKWWMLHIIILPIYSMLAAWSGICVSVKAKSSYSAISISFLVILPLILISLLIFEGTLIFNLKFTFFATILGIVLLTLVKTIANHLLNSEKLFAINDIDKI